MSGPKPMTENLNQAKRNKKDEVYTQLMDIEKEMADYRDQFRGKMIYCNCDDPRVATSFATSATISSVLA